MKCNSKYIKGHEIKWQTCTIDAEVPQNKKRKIYQKNILVQEPFYPIGIKKALFFMYFCHWKWLYRLLVRRYLLVRNFLIYYGYVLPCHSYLQCKQ